MKPLSVFTILQVSGDLSLKGWTGNLLRVDLTKGKVVRTEYSEELAKKFIGGRGLAVKLLWDELKPGTDPLGPDNILIFAVGLYAGLPTSTAARWSSPPRAPSLVATATAT